MIPTPDSIKRYQSAKDRFFKPVLINFFARECPKVFGPLLRDRLADELIRLFRVHRPETTHLQAGQILWNALDKHTRGDSPNRRYVPVILTLISSADVAKLTQGTWMSQIAQEAIARMIKEAYEQGGILSSRDLGLLTLRNTTSISQLRKKYEEKHLCTLPHTGTIHDMGSSVSHKTLIVRKVILEKKDPAAVARETNHSQRAVDRYLKDYHRVKSLLTLNHDIEFIHLTTQIAKYVIKQYIKIIQNESNPA